MSRLVLYFLITWTISKARVNAQIDDFEDYIEDFNNLDHPPRTTSRPSWSSTTPAGLENKIYDPITSKNYIPLAPVPSPEPNTYGTISWNNK